MMYSNVFFPMQLSEFITSVNFVSNLKKKVKEKTHFFSFFNINIDFYG